jgi:argininosuccinate lyase
MKSKLNLDLKVVDSARQHAANIAHDMQDFIDRHTTVSTERTILRLLGVDGVDDMSLEDYKSHSELFAEDLYEEISLKTCVSKRISEGATGYKSVEKQINGFIEFLNEQKGN